MVVEPTGGSFSLLRGKKTETLACHGLADHSIYVTKAFAALKRKTMSDGVKGGR